jgi:uncharacterized membrane-anchored protein
MGLVLISFKIYGISTGLILLIIGFTRQKQTLIVLGGLSIFGFFSWYYYNLHATLLFKSLSLMALGVVMLAAWFGIKYLYESKSNSQTQNRLNQLKFRTINKNKWLAAVTVFIAIIAINININKKQDIIANGQVLLFKIAPADPSSIMQGDYMNLRFEVAAKIRDKVILKNKGARRATLQGSVVVEKGENNIVSFVDLFHQQELESNQFVVPYKIRNYRVTFTTNAFYFQEGKASHFQQSQYGQFRMSDSGEMLLVNMIDSEFNVL